MGIGRGPRACFPVSETRRTTTDEPVAVVGGARYLYRRTISAAGRGFLLDFGSVAADRSSRSATIGSSGNDGSAVARLDATNKSALHHSPSPKDELDEDLCFF